MTVPARSLFARQRVRALDVVAPHREIALADAIRDLGIRIVRMRREVAELREASAL